MGLVTGVTLPNDGDRVQAADYNDPINKILDEVNGNLDSNNIASLSGAKINAGTIPVTAMDSTVGAGWTPLSATFSVASGYNQGNKSFVLDSNTDLSSQLYPGMRFKVNRSTAAPTQAVDLEASSSQYATKASPTGISFTDNFTCEAWLKLESYTGALQRIVSRYSGTGWIFGLESDGRITIYGQGASTRSYTSTAAIPLGRWVHVAASMNMAGGSGAIYIDGIAVSTSTTGSGTSLTQSGDLQIGAATATNFFDGEMTGVRIWSTVRTATQIQDNMCQQLTGSETGLVGYWKLNGDYNDSTSNANNLTAVNSPVFVTDNPMKSTEYAIITKVTSTQITVFTGTDYSIPNMTLSSPYFSTQKAPFGFPIDQSKWTVSLVITTDTSQASPAIGTYYNVGPCSIGIPVGSWKVSIQGVGYASRSAAGNMSFAVGLSTSSSAAAASGWQYRSLFITGTNYQQIFRFENELTLTAATTYYIVMATDQASQANIGLLGSSAGTTLVKAVCSLL